MQHPWTWGSVRTRTTGAATLVVGIGLALAGIGLVTVLRASLVANVEQVAELHAADVAAGLTDAPPARVIEADDDELVQVVDAQSRVVASSRNIQGQPPVTSLTPQPEESRAVTITNPAGLDGTYRVVAISTDAPESLTVYVGTNLKQADHTTFLLQRAVLVAVPLLLTLVAGMTWLAVGRTLRPVEQMRRQVADISGTDSGRRVPVPTTNDEIRRLALTMNAMLDRLQQAAQREARFVADASHELQSPLAAARTQLEVALEDPQDDRWLETAQRLLETNYEMEQLVSDLLFVARSDSGSSLSRFQPVDLHELLLDEVTRVQRATGVAIDCRDVTAAVVPGRRDDLARVARNLLSNAVQHAATSVELSLRCEDDFAVLAVSDDGPGVAPGDRARIFERFSRLDAARTRRDGGTGLGLAIVKDVIDQHGGSVTVETASPGARFVVRLPT